MFAIASIVLVFLLNIAGVVCFHERCRALSTIAKERRSTSVKGSASDLPGALPPLGFFDPLGLSEGKSELEVKKIREAELKHGRLAMLASLGIITQESFNPLFDGKIEGPAIYHFQQVTNLFPNFWMFVLFGIGLVEGQNILVGWDKIRDMNGIAQLKPEYINGDLGFDPLNLMPDDEASFNRLRTKELQNGRLAMIGVAGMVAQELVNQKGILDNFRA